MQRKKITLNVQGSKAVSLRLPLWLIFTLDSEAKKRYRSREAVVRECLLKAFPETPALVEAARSGLTKARR